MPIKDPVLRRQYQVDRMDRARRQWLSENGPCVRCGSDEDLEVDHIDPTTKVAHRVWSWAKARRDAELAKCQVLCSPCHKEKTSAWRAEAPIQHGTDGAYTKRLCRCPECTEAHRIVKQAWRDGRKAAGLSYS